MYFSLHSYQTCTVFHINFESPGLHSKIKSECMIYFNGNNLYRSINKESVHFRWSVCKILYYVCSYKSLVLWKPVFSNAFPAVGIVTFFDPGGWKSTWVTVWLVCSTSETELSELERRLSCIRFSASSSLQQALIFLNSVGPSVILIDRD